MNPNPMKMYFYRVIEHWHGQVAVAAAIASINFMAMYCVYLNLSERLPDGTKSYEITGVYRKYTDMKGRTDSTLNRKTIYCGISAFSEVSCGFDGDGEMTVTIDRFPNLFGDVDVVVTAKNNQKIIYNYNTLKIVEYWKNNSVFNCKLYSFLVFIGSILGLRNLNKHRCNRDRADQG